MVWVSSQVSHFVSAAGVIFSVSYPDSPYYVSLPLISSPPLRTQEAGPAQIGARFVTPGTIPFHYILRSSSKEQSFQSMRHPFSKAVKDQAYYAPNAVTVGAQTQGTVLQDHQWFSFSEARATVPR